MQHSSCCEKGANSEEWESNIIISIPQSRVLCTNCSNSKTRERWAINRHDSGINIVTYCYECLWDMLFAEDWDECSVSLNLDFMSIIHRNRKYTTVKNANKQQ